MRLFCYQKWPLVIVNLCFIGCTDMYIILLRILLRYSAAIVSITLNFLFICFSRYMWIYVYVPLINVWW